jgi:isocitrate lyase
MRYVRDWFASFLPFVVHTRSGFHRVEKSAFELGRDYERGRVKAVRERVERLEAQVDELTA